MKAQAQAKMQQQMQREGAAVANDLRMEQHVIRKDDPASAKALADAKERVKELEAILSKSERDRSVISTLTKELDEMKVEKVSMEYLLRESRNSHQQETEDTAVELKKAKELLSEQREEIERLKDKILMSPTPALAHQPNEKLTQRNETLIKERKAIKTIMEQKIKVLVNSVAQSTHAVLNENVDAMGTQSGQNLAKDMAALKRLVHAAVTALANADGGDESKN